MSGTVATLSAVASVGSALETLSFGAAGPVVLGAFCFQDFEVPAAIVLPVKQAIAVHKLIGGARVLASMGPDYGDVTWRGCMLGALAAERAQMLKSVVDSGQMVALTWGTWALVVVPCFVALTERYQRVDYVIRCAVIRDGSSAPVARSIDLNTSVVQDIASAAAQGGAALSGILGKLQSTLQQLAPILPGSRGTGAALTALAGAQNAARTAASVAAVGISGVGVRALGLELPVGSMNDLGTVTNATGTLAQAGAAGAFLGRIAANLAANL